MHRFSSAGTEIAYMDEGDGAPVLLIHGFASNWRVNWVEPSWTGTLLRAGYRVIALDNRGHGHSAKLYEETAYGAAIMADDAVRLLDHLGIAKAHVMGYSMGARIAAFMAMTAPERLITAVFGGLGINMVRGLPGARAIAHALMQPSIDDVVSETARTFRAFAEQTGSDLKALAACIVGSRDKVTPEMLARIRTPVLVCVGSADVVGGSAAELAALIPGAEAFTIEGRDHMKAVGDRRFKEAVLAFLGRHGGASAAAL